MYPKKFFSTCKEPIEEGTAFILMPFAPDFEPTYKIIKQVLGSQEFNIKCYRSDELYKPEPIIETILRGIAVCQFIIADVTSRNPNVFYELGIAHMVKDSCIILTQNIDDVPFDLRHLHCIIYENSLNGAEKLKNNLRMAIRAVLDKQDKLNNESYTNLAQKGPINILERFTKSIITYRDLLEIESDVEENGEIWVLTSALDLEADELKDIIRDNLRKKIKYIYFIPLENKFIRKTMVEMAREWQIDCRLSRDEAKQLIKCYLVPEHFTYMTVIIYNAQNHTKRNPPTVLVKFPDSNIYEKEKYPFIYRVDTQPEEAWKTFSKAITDFMEEPMCSLVTELNINFHNITMPKVTYYPWSEEVLNECLLGQDKGELVTLDLDFTSQCTTASCIYCDSRPSVGFRNPNELGYLETEKLLIDAKKLGLRWIYACGLGEPSEDHRFKNLVELAYKLDINLSIFTNGVLINKKTAKWLHEKKVSLILKLDTFKEENFDIILGKKGTAKKVYNAIEFLLDAGYGRNYKSGYTDLAFSIVPTILNIHDIEKVIKYANENNIFPSIGELEQAGRSSGETYSNLALDKENLSMLKKKVDGLLWEGYTRPICPAIITGMHIDNVGNCIVDQETGLNCKWFLLREPMVSELGNIRRNDLATIFRSVRDYRRSCFSTNDNAVRQYESIEYTFGGCGGSPRKIIQLAKRHL